VQQFQPVNCEKRIKSQCILFVVIYLYVFCVCIGLTCGIKFAHWWSETGEPLCNRSWLFSCWYVYCYISYTKYIWPFWICFELFYTLRK